MTTIDAFTTRPELRGTFGVAASTHWLASAVAMAALERGGNAFDGAVAAAFVLQVVEPHLNGPGGEVPILLWSEREQRARAICGQGVAPRAASVEAFEQLGLELVPGTGLLPACVPGAFGAWLLLLRDHGTLRLRDALEPAIGYAEQGFPLVPRICQAILAVRRLFLDEWPTSAAVYLPGGNVPALAEPFRNRPLAATYRRILALAEAAASDRDAQIEAARKAWYEGFVADAIERFYRGSALVDCSGERHGGLLTGQDLAQWRATYEEPVTLDYGRYRIAKCGPWSQGPVLLQQLALLRGFDLAAMDPLGPAFAHTVIEAAKLAFADRDAWYADPRGADVPLENLLSEAYAAERRRLVDPSRASLEVRPGSPGGRAPRYPGFAAVSERLARSGLAFGAGEPTFAELPHDGSLAADGRAAGDTCQLNVIDRWGNMVAATPSGGWLSSTPVVPELGFGLGTRLQMAWLDRSLQNTLRPGHRPLTTLSPSLAFRDGEPYLAFGTPGGDQQDQWQAAFFLRHVHHGFNLQQAIDAPAWHMEHFIASFWPRRHQRGAVAVESRLSEAAIMALQIKGHRVRVGEPWSEGRLSACTRERRRGGLLLRAAANPRGMQGYAAGR
jgi:gamma-glutamyltranspeptidase/glutathione hydrolase